MAFAVAPLAQAETPAPGYGQFTGCPSAKENPSVTGCTRSVIKSGKFKMGSKNVPIENPMTLVGGITENGDIVHNSSGGLSKTKQKVPGGVVGLTGLTWLAEVLGSEALTLYAVTELAGTPNLGESLKLPIKVHLVNPVLGNNCYVGSNSDPINLNLITGTTSPPPPNQPITGKEPEFTVNQSNGVLEGKNGTFVDNSFSAPGASGCTLTLFGFLPVGLNDLVDLQAGLPAAAGTNETVQNFDLEIVEVGLVYP